jgi:hypothetical protein
MRLIICLLLTLAIAPNASAGVGPAVGRPIPLLDLEDAARYLFGAAWDLQWHDADEQVAAQQEAFRRRYAGDRCAVWHLHGVREPLLSNREHLLGFDKRRNPRSREADGSDARPGLDL